MGGIIFVFPAKHYSIGLCNCPVCKVKNNIGKFVFWRDVSYSP